MPTKKELEKQLEGSNKAFNGLMATHEELHEYVTDLQFKYKYVVFDLEATVRERDHYKKLLDIKKNGG